MQVELKSSTTALVIRPSGQRGLSFASNWWVRHKRSLWDKRISSHDAIGSGRPCLEVLVGAQAHRPRLSIVADAAELARRDLRWNERDLDAVYADWDPEIVVHPDPATPP